MMARRLRVLAGEGTATGVLVAGTVTNVAAVTLPSDAGFEYDVNVSVMIKSSSTTMAVVAQIGGLAASCFASTTTTATPHMLPSTMSGARAPSSSLDDWKTINTVTTLPSKFSPLRQFTAGPGQTITVPILSELADTYYVHYKYVGRKVIETVTGGF
jgi:hypothetical protein